MVVVTRILPLLVLLPACSLNDRSASEAIARSATASVSLTGASTSATLSSNAQWTLTKTGSQSGGTVPWNITATKTATVSGQLVVQGELTFANSGSGPATIGNSVVNLQ